MYKAFFGLTSNPFNLSPDPSFLYRSPFHEEALANLIYGVKPTDPLTFGAVSLVLATVGLFASIIPAYRAIRVEPMKTLRDE